METIADIVREMREWPSAIDKSDAEYLADRIEKAEKRNACHEDGVMTTVSIELCNLKAENARLRAALKPVLDFKYPDREVYSVECEYAKMLWGMMTAVLEAQRIYNESEVNE